MNYKANWLSQWEFFKIFDDNSIFMKQLAFLQYKAHWKNEKLHDFFNEDLLIYDSMVLYLEPHGEKNQT